LPAPGQEKTTHHQWIHHLHYYFWFEPSDTVLSNNRKATKKLRDSVDSLELAGNKKVCSKLILEQEKQKKHCTCNFEEVRNQSVTGMKPDTLP